MMNIVLKIFAQVGTNKKVLFPVPNDFNALPFINDKFGGSWVYVDRLKPGEGLPFEDGLIYQGYSPNIERYTDKPEKITP